MPNEQARETTPLISDGGNGDLPESVQQRVVEDNAKYLALTFCSSSIGAAGGEIIGDIVGGTVGALLGCTTGASFGILIGLGISNLWRGREAKSTSGLASVPITVPVPDTLTITPQLKA